MPDRSVATPWTRDASRRALDQLFDLARKYRTSTAYRELLDFVVRFRFYSPYNAMLLHVQRPGATFVAPADRWLNKYGRRTKTNASPLVILRPMGPVLFVFDVSDTELEPGAPPLPVEVERPFEVRTLHLGDELVRTITNVGRDGLAVSSQAAGSQSAGSIRLAGGTGRHIDFMIKASPKPECVRVPLRYEILLNSTHSAPAQYATLVHELAHLYCGHLGTPDDDWWPDRRAHSHYVKEVEAESISYLVCRRLGIETRSAEYLARLEQETAQLPDISLELVMTVAGLIEKMAGARLKPRLKRAPARGSRP